MTAASSAQDDPLVRGLETTVDETVAALKADPVFSTIFDGTASREVYLKYLERTYHYVNYTTVQLKQAARVFADRPGELEQAMHQRFVHHAKEEHGHELWVLDDIRAIGGDADAAIKADPGLAVKAYLSMAELVLGSRTPLAFIGLGGLLEGISAQLGTLAATNMRSHSKIPNVGNALKFFDSHGEADTVHIIEQRETLVKIRGEEDRRALLVCAQMTAFQYRHLLA